MSNINPYNIDGTFPIAGQDNDSQGFRDNFTNTKNNFIFAASELADLQAKAITTSALNGQTLQNNMNGTALTAPQLVAWTQGLIDLGNQNGSVTFNFNLGNFQKCTPTTAVTVGFSNWPQLTGTGPIGYGVLRVWFVITSTNFTVTLPSTVSVGQSDMAGYVASTNTITFDAPGNYVFDFSSTDGGTSYLVFDLTRNRATLRDPSLYFNSTISPALYVGFNAAGLGVAQAIEPYPDSITFKGGINGFNTGTLNLATPSSPVFSDGSGEAPGYHLYAARGNVSAGNTQPVLGNDYLGYYSSMALTGNVTGTGNSYQQTSSIQCYATGANIQYGLGGNIAFYTKKDGVAGVSQALSITNTQTVEVVGSFQTDGAIIESGTVYSAQPTTGFTYTFANNTVSSLIVDATGTMSSGTFVLPASPVNMQTVRISATQAITTANVYAGALVPVVGLGTASATTVFNSTSGSSIRLTYISAQGKWFRS